MRVLHEQECAAVAGGHESECERGLKKALFVAGALAGGALGNLPGAAGGAGLGVAFAEAFGHEICAMDDHEGQGDEDEDHGIDPEILKHFEQQFVNWWLRSFGSDITGPHELVVEQSY